MPADYHHLPKVLDLIAALGPEYVSETSSGDDLYATLIKSYFPGIKFSRKSADLAIFPVLRDDHHVALDEIRNLLRVHRGVIVVAPKTTWDKADFAGIGPTMFVNDTTMIIAYLGTTADIKKLRHELLRNRVQRQLTGTKRDRRLR